LFLHTFFVLVNVTSCTFIPLFPSLYPYLPPNYIVFIKQTFLHTPSHAVLTNNPTCFGVRRPLRHGELSHLLAFQHVIWFQTKVRLSDAYFGVKSRA